MAAVIGTILLSAIALIVVIVTALPADDLNLVAVLVTESLLVIIMGIQIGVIIMRPSTEDIIHKAQHLALSKRSKDR